MSFRSHIAVLFSAAAVAIILSHRAAEAVVVQLTFSGTYSTSGPAVFGESGSAVPFSYEMTYDTDLAPPPVFIATGDDLGLGNAAAHDMYGYGELGVTASSFVFGTKTWEWPEDHVPKGIGNSLVVALWFDAEIATETPSRLRVFLRDADGELEIGGVGGGGGETRLNDESLVDDAQAQGGRAYCLELEIASTIVPEPATFISWLVAAAALLAFLRRWRR